MKNYAAIYNSGNDASSLEQKWYLKAESQRGILAPPTDTDFFYALEGGTINYGQPFEESPHRSGRHVNNIIKSKKTLDWGFQTFINIDEALGSPLPTEIDQSIRTLFTSLLGNEEVLPGGGIGLEYTSQTAPDITFSLYSVVDKFAQQARGCFVEAGNFTFPGDGQAQIDWSGFGKDAFTIGIGASTVANNGGSTITLVSGDGRQFKKDGLVMIVSSDGTTRSADSPSGTALKVSDVTGDVVTLTDLADSPVVLADADGTVPDPVYLVYYEPANPVAIDNPIVGLRGGFLFDGIAPTNCIRSISINMTNSHELVDYCAGEDSLSGPLFIPGDRFRADVEMVINMNKELVAFFRDVEEFTPKEITAQLGDITGRHLEAFLPKVIFPVPSIPVPASGSIPVTFTGGKALQTAQDAADELAMRFK